MEPATPVVIKREVEKDLFVWRAPARAYQPRTREFFVTLFAIVGLVGLVLFIAEGAMPVVLLIAIVFLFYVLSTVKPEEIEYKITNKGIKIAGNKTDWQFMNRFCFTKKGLNDVLLIETYVIPGRLELVVNAGDIEVIRKNLLENVPEEEISPTGLEKLTTWFASRLPGNS